ncbi:arginase [Aureibacter tunicatorum]|uniref:Arginase n=1 Tax=Aureibacter tunicatorum TaxID=866807 RepID=A0AAE3XRT0_9BACT|nr:arginase [Aureibacter tunicatorum]MDR6240721.1 arginase [Aureibacter tunicatorum]BDD06946.1 arginase [Aureibacter tunicatorum]
MKTKSLKLISVPSEIAAGTRGASMGYQALVVASLNAKSKFFFDKEVAEVETENELLLDENPYPYAKRINGVKNVLTNVSDSVAEELSEENFPLVLAGDHSTAAGTISGIKKANPGKRLGVIWIDAHGDLHTPYTTPSGNMHGMPLAMVAGIDNLEQQINEPKEQTKELWEDIKNIGIDGPKVEMDDIVFIGVRDTEDPEDRLIEKYGIRNIKVSEVKEMGAVNAAQEALDLLKNCDIIYVSFDVDSMDSRISAGTGTPVIDGLSVEEARDINRQLVANDKVVCWEMVEINPTLDQENTMAENAFNILVQVTETVESKIQESCKA